MNFTKSLLKLLRKNHEPTSEELSNKLPRMREQSFTSKDDFKSLKYDIIVPNLKHPMNAPAYQKRKPLDLSMGSVNYMML